MQQSEKEIIGRVLSGRSDEFGYFLDTYGDMVFTMIVGLVGSEQDAEELTQDTFLRAYQKLDSFLGEARFSTWICRIAYNLALSHLRRKNLAPPMEELPEERISDEEENGEVEAFFEEDSDPRVELLEAAIERLAPHERTLISLFYYEEKSLQEIAYIMLGDSRKFSTISSQLSRLRKRLYQLMKSDL